MFSAPILFYVNKEKEIVCKIDMTSKSPSSEDILMEYPEPRSMNISCGIAKVGKFVGSGDMVVIAEEIITISEEFFIRELTDYIINPINEFVNL